MSESEDADSVPALSSVPDEIVSDVSPPSSHELEDQSSTEPPAAIVPPAASVTP